MRRKREFLVEGKTLYLHKSSGVAAKDHKGRWRRGPFLWLGIRTPGIDEAVHLSLGEARRLRDALNRWLQP